MERYRQQMILPEIGIGGQEKISSGSVLIVGAGGLGAIVASYLASMGIGNIGICDFDLVEESNLHRQIFYTPDDIGRNKAEVLSETLQRQNPGIIITPFLERFNHANGQKLTGKYQIICDCTDNVPTRLLLNEYCYKNSVSLVHGAVSGWQGYVTVFHYNEKYSYADLFDANELFRSESCAQNGINSAVCGIIGSYMAAETIKIILRLDQVLEGKLLYINTLNNVIRYINLKKHFIS